MGFVLTTVKLGAANDFVDRLHRHHKRVPGHKFSLAAWRDGRIVGVAIVGRPVAREEGSGIALQVVRLCTDGTRNACSFLYAACERAARALGYFGIDTFIKDEEPGTSLKAVGWDEQGSTPGRSWSVPSRAREEKPTTLGKKRKYGRAL